MCRPLILTTKKKQIMKKIIQVMMLLLCLQGGKAFAQFNVHLSKTGQIIIDKTGGKNGEISFYNTSPSDTGAKPITDETINNELFENDCKSNSKPVTLKFKGKDSKIIDVPIKYDYDCEKGSLTFFQGDTELKKLFFYNKAFSETPPIKDDVVEVDENDESQVTDQSRLRNEVSNIIKREKFTVLKGQNNLVLDKSGTIIVFIDGDGMSIYNDYPKSGRENYDRYKFYVLTLEKGDYKVNCEGVFVPIKLSDEVEEVGENAAATGEDESEKKVYVYKSDVFGPYTDSFDMTLKKGKKLIIKKSIKLLPVKRISVGTSVISTWLKNPENIETFTKPNGDLTLIADDPTNRGFLGLFLTFHLSPRNLDVEPRNNLERLGISVGTNLSDKSFNNFFVGLNYEVRNGLYINGGIHFGRVNNVVGYDNFDFGHDVFEGTLEVRKKWKVGGPYISINIDTDVFGKVFKNLLGTSAAP